MIYLRLFLTFLKIGAFSFGGGYGMISLMREECLAYGWLTEAELLNMIAVAESTPGPIAVNMATFVGSAQGGLLGAVLATLGVILPSFIIILLIAVVLKNVLHFAGVKAAIKSIRPAVCGLIIAAACVMLLKMVFELIGVLDLDLAELGSIKLDKETLWWIMFGGLICLLAQWKIFFIFFLLIIITKIYWKCKKKPFSPILLIFISGCLGIVLFL